MRSSAPTYSVVLNLVRTRKDKEWNFQDDEFPDIHAGYGGNFWNVALCHPRISKFRTKIHTKDMFPAHFETIKVNNMSGSSNIIYGQCTKTSQVMHHDCFLENYQYISRRIFKLRGIKRRFFKFKYAPLNLTYTPILILLTTPLK